MERHELALNVGRRVKKVLRDRGLRIADLARLVGVHYDTARKWIRGDRLLKGENLLKVAQVLNVSVDYLMFGNRDRAESAKEPFPRYQQIMSLARSERFDAIVQVAKDQVGCSFVAFPDAVKRDYEAGRVSEEEVYEQVVRLMEKFKGAA